MKHRSGKNGRAKTMSVNVKFLPGVIILLIISTVVMQSCTKTDFKSRPVSAANDLQLSSGSYDLKLVADSLVSPVTVVDANDGTKRLFVVEQTGQIWIIGPNGSRLNKPFIDISNKMVNLMPGYDERGLLGLAFHPDYKNNGKFYLFYTAPPRNGGPDSTSSWDNTTRISEFKVLPGNPNKADMSSERIIFQANHPQFNHNGGTIAFGPDGYLYISIGDGGNGDDIGPGHVNDWYLKNAGGNGQDIKQNLLGNILRIDVNTTSNQNAYGIPADNPFVGKQGRDEIYAFGFRNPYRFSFDLGGQHWLYAGDAGQSLYEEVDVVTKGGNYGWNVKEGTHCFNTDNDLKERNACPVEDTSGNPLIDPVIELTNFSNPEGGGITIAVVGGNVYRGTSLPLLYGRYIFGSLSADFGPTGKIMVAKSSTIGLWSFEPLPLKSFPNTLGQYLKGFGQGLDGEIYVTTSKQIGPQGHTGKVYKIVFVP